MLLFPQGRLESHHFVLGYTQRNQDAGKFLWLNPGPHGEYLAIQRLWLTATLSVTRVSPIYLVDDFSFLFLVLLKEMRTLGEYKILSFLLLVLIKGMEKCGESKTFFCTLMDRKLLIRPFASGMV